MEGIIMKKILVLIFQVLIGISIYSYDFYVIKDTYLYDPSTLRKITSIPKKTEITVDKIGTGWFYKDNKHEETADAIKITYNKIKGYIPLEDIVSIDNVLIPNDLNISEWIPAYELDVLYSRNRMNLEDYVSFYRNYDKWRKYTDWDEDDWYSSHTPPQFVFVNSVIKIGSFNIFNGYIANLIAKTENKKIAMQCVESENSGYDYDIPDYFTDIFLEGESYNLDYEIDGDYLYLTVNNQTKITLVRMRPGYSKVLFKFYVNTITEEDYKSIVWPRHADDSCDYEPSNEQLVSKTAPTAQPQTNVTLGKLMTASDNLRLRSGEETSSAVITTMLKGTTVKVVKLGKQETIDGITSNWVQIEVQNGKDRDGKKIKEGTIGWCFGGYLDPKP